MQHETLVVFIVMSMSKHTCSRSAHFYAGWVGRWIWLWARRSPRNFCHVRSEFALCRRRGGQHVISKVKPGHPRIRNTYSRIVMCPRYVLIIPCSNETEILTAACPWSTSYMMSSRRLKKYLQSPPRSKNESQVKVDVHIAHDHIDTYMMT